MLHIFLVSEDTEEGNEDEYENSDADECHEDKEDDEETGSWLQQQWPLCIHDLEARSPSGCGLGGAACLPDI